MLDLLEQGFTIVNIDESWLNELDFRRRKWHACAETNSLPTQSTRPRLSVIAAIDTRGRIFMALTTVNTTSEVICLFLKRLVYRLNIEDGNFRDKTVFQLDGAKYHRSYETRNLLANLGVKTIISGPYGYNIAPIEMLFAALKCTDLNPARIKTGKK